MIKMNALLAKVQQAQPQFMQSLNAQTQVFARQQGKFQGRHNTHVGKNDYPSEVTKNKNERVNTTVDEQLVYLEKVIIPYLNDLFAIERTNSKGANAIELVVDGISMGNFTAIELMRLKNILNSKELLTVYSSIPTRTDSNIWEESDDEEYKQRGIVQSPLIKEVTRTTIKTPYILKDPNINPDNPPATYRPAVMTEDKTIETGDATRQEYSGEWTQERKAYLLKRLSDLKQAVVTALSVVNEAEATQGADMSKIIQYLHGDIIGRK